MRLLIMSDMEGVSGIVAWDQVSYKAPMYEAGCRLYTEEVNAAVRGAIAAGTTEIVAVDCHGAGGDASFNSYVPELLHPEVEWVAHHPWGRYTHMFETGCDGVLLIGMHAKSNTPDGVMCHTISTTTWRDLRFNGTSVGESGINAALCGHYGVPVLFVSGDAATCREARALLGKDLRTVAVKEGLGRFSARQVAPVRARRLIEEGVRQAVESFRRGGPHPAPYDPGRPCAIDVELTTVDTANRFQGRHGVEVVEPLLVVSRGRDWMTAWNQIWDY
jgi:D-amino peptidase